MNEDRLLDAAEIAEKLGVPKTWVLAQARAGHMPHVKLGMYRRFVWPDVEAWVESLKSGGGPTYRTHLPRRAA